MGHHFTTCFPYVPALGPTKWSSSVPAVRPAPGPSTCPTFEQLLVLLKIVKCLHCTICHCFTNSDNVAHSPIVALGSIVSHGTILCMVPLFHMVQLLCLAPFVPLGAIVVLYMHCAILHMDCCAW